MLSPSVKPVVLRAASHSSLACKTRRLLDGQSSRPLFPTESCIAPIADSSAFRCMFRSWLVKFIRTAGYFSRDWPAHPLNIRGGEAVHAEGVGDLAAVMYVVLDDVPDDPSAGVGVYLAFPLILDSRLQICERRASQHLLHDLPGFFQSAYQLIRRAW